MINKESNPRQSQYVTRRIVGQSDLNPNGTLFGGIMMSWMDEVAFQSARKYSGRPFCVTVNIDNIVFLEPIKLGETVVLTSQVNYVGKSSMEIGVRVEKEDPYTGDLKHTNSAYLTFVALNEKSKPAEVPKLILETEDDIRRHTEAKIRVKVRNRMKSAMKRKLESKLAPFNSVDSNQSHKKNESSSRASMALQFDRVKNDFLAFRALAKKAIHDRVKTFLAVQKP